MCEVGTDLGKESPGCKASVLQFSRCLAIGGVGDVCCGAFLVNVCHTLRTGHGDSRMIAYRCDHARAKRSLACPRPAISRSAPSSSAVRQMPSGISPSRIRTEASTAIPLPEAMQARSKRHLMDWAVECRSCLSDGDWTCTRHTLVP